MLSHFGRRSRYIDGLGRGKRVKFAQHAPPILLLAGSMLTHTQTCGTFPRLRRRHRQAGNERRLGVSAWRKGGGGGTNFSYAMRTKELFHAYFKLRMSCVVVVVSC